MKFAHCSLLAAILYAVTESAQGANCADVMGIDATPKDRHALRDLLRKGSLSTLSSESCRDYQVKLLRDTDQGWTVLMTSRTSTRKIERRVTRLAYAATWIEAWSQSGFMPPVEEPKSAPNTSTVPPAPVSTPASPPPPSLFLGLDPLVAVTSRGYGLVGASLFGGYPAKRLPWYGFELGAATQFGTEGSDYRRAYWAGPMVGGVLAISDHFRMRPAVSLGVMGSAVRLGGKTAGAAVPYAGISTEVEFDLTSRLALSVGFDARLLFGDPAATVNGTVTSIDDDGEVETESVSTTVSSGLGQLWGALKLGAVWHFGEPS